MSIKSAFWKSAVPRTVPKLWSNAAGADITFEDVLASRTRASGGAERARQIGRSDESSAKEISRCFDATAMPQ
jgi:hypothetical protein